MFYEVKGVMRLGSEKRPFVKVVDAKSEKHAKELVYSLLGAQHGIRRTEVKIEQVVKKEEVS
ncbi:50S ribosomal protein L18a [Candidatus Micrarchaeota archaeon]|nr:50S ribosomal protein L18a [Candidatus Micrarchaeota archaeon]